MIRRGPIVVLVVMAFAVACGESPPPEPSGVPASVLEDVSSDPGRLQVEVNGATAINFDRTLPIQIYIGGQHESVPENLKLLSVGLLQHVQLDDGRLMRLAFDYLGYTSDGMFTIEETQMGDSGSPASTITSNVFVEILPENRDYTQGFRYDVLLRNCDLETMRRGREGTLSCPEIRHGTEGVISLVMRWNVPSAS